MKNLVRIHNQKPFTKAILWMWILFLLKTITLEASPVKLDLKADKLLIKTELIQNLFSLKIGNPVALLFNDAAGNEIKFSGSVVNYMNPGETSGTLVISLKAPEGNFKLYARRKSLNGKLIYTIQMLETGTKNGYLLQAEKDGKYELNKTEDKKIVTE